MNLKFREHDQSGKKSREERRMAFKADYDHNCNSFPHEEIEFLVRKTSWTCCSMTLPSSFYLCPICGLEQGMDDDDALLYFD